MVERIEPTEHQREILDKLLKNYKLAIKLVNAETMKGRLNSRGQIVLLHFEPMERTLLTI